MTKSVCRGELLFLAPGDAAKGRVEPISWMRTCEAFADAGLAVTLKTLRVRRPDGVTADGLWDHYGIAETFRVVATRTALRRDAPTWRERVIERCHQVAVVGVQLGRFAVGEANDQQAKGAVAGGERYADSRGWRRAAHRSHATSVH